jgi:hypothetical protein
MPETTYETVSRAGEQLEQLERRRPKPISTTTHGVLDYTLGPTLAFLPQVFGFTGGGPSAMVPTVYGAASMVYSSLTRYELGMYPVLPMRTHLIIDAIAAGFMAASPWVIGFGRRKRARSWLPHLAFAVTELAIVALSDSRSKR